MLNIFSKEATATTQASTAAGSININVPADSPMGQNRIFRRVALLCQALADPNISAERAESLTDELMAHRYTLVKQGYKLSKSPAEIYDTLQSILNKRG